MRNAAVPADSTPARMRRANSCITTPPITSSFPITRITSASSYQELPHALHRTTSSSSFYPATFVPHANTSAMHCDELSNDAIHTNTNNNNQQQQQPIDATAAARPVSRRRHSVDHSNSNINNTNTTEQPPELSAVQKAGCYRYMQQRLDVALAFAATPPPGEAAAASSFSSSSNWTPVKSKHGVTLFKSTRSRCEVRAVTRVNASVKHVMALLASSAMPASDTNSSNSKPLRFVDAQRVLLGDSTVLHARVLAQCVPPVASRFFHCGLKQMALTNPFGGAAPLDLVFLDYTNVTSTATPHDGNKLLGYRLMESIRVPQHGATASFTRASLRCEIYIVKELGATNGGGVEVTFASHLDPKSRFAKRSQWLELAATRLRNLRNYAETTNLSHRLDRPFQECTSHPDVLSNTNTTSKIVSGSGDITSSTNPKGNNVRKGRRSQCAVCNARFAFLLRTRHSCRLCASVACGRCSRKLPVVIDAVTTRVRVCLRCQLAARLEPDELGRSQFKTNVTNRTRDVGDNATYIAYDECSGNSANGGGNANSE